MAEEDVWPEVGELVVATVKRIVPYGAYVELDEYGGKEGLIHISEISSSWVRNIRHFVREGQKVVLQVLRVDKAKGHIDLSLRRVSKSERRRRMLEYKRERKAESVIITAAERLGMAPEELFDMVGDKLLEVYDTLYEGMIAVIKKGPEMLERLGVPSDVAKVVADVASKKVRIPMVKISGTLTLTCYKPDGVKSIKEALISAEKSASRGVEVRVYTVGPPKYKIEVRAENYKKAERALSRAVEKALAVIKARGGSGSFERD